MEILVVEEREQGLGVGEEDHLEELATVAHIQQAAAEKKPS